MQDYDVSDLVDERSEDIWHLVKNHFTITLDISRKGYYYVSVSGNNATIYFPPNDQNPELFVHELLHLYLQIKGIKVAECLMGLFAADSVLNSNFKFDLVEHMANCLDHDKTFSLYKKLGFDESKFIDDYSIPKFDIRELQALKNTVEKYGRLTLKGASVYLSTFFAVKGCPNKELDYKNVFELLKNVDSDLFSLSGKFWDSWSSFDMETYARATVNYQGYCKIFCDDLSKWTMETRSKTLASCS